MLKNSKPNTTMHPLNQTDREGVYAKKIFGSVAAGAIVFLSACQTMPYQPYARNVKVEPQAGGVVALKLEHQDEDRAKAQSMMANNCAGNAVKVLEEGETVIGTETSSKETNEAKKNGKFAISAWLRAVRKKSFANLLEKNPATRKRGRDLKEARTHVWRIHPA
jgi:hypothetical protein